MASLDLIKNTPSLNPVVMEARRWLNTPYKHQASEIGIGTDCLGLIRGI